MLTAAIGVSDSLDIDDATSTVIRECRQQLGTTEAQVGIVFTSRMNIDLKVLLRTINQSFPGIQLIGCTTDGEIGSGFGYFEDAVALLLLASDTMQFATAIAPNLSTSATDSYRQAYEQCLQQLDSPPVMGLTLPDGLSTTGVSLDQAIQSAMGNSFPVFGGTAGDAFQFAGTFQFHNSQVYQDAAPLLLFGGDVTYESMINIGVEPIGPFYSIDSVKDNIVYSIEGKKAAEVYEELLGEYTYEQQAIQFPLAIYEDEGTDFYLRDPLNVNKEDGSVTFIGNFPEKCKARFITIDRDHMFKSADDANTYLLTNSPEKPSAELVFVFSCTSRKHVLGSQTKRELAKLMQGDTKVPFFGFYCYGEIGPMAKGEPTRFHNDTYVAIGIRSASS